MISLKKLSKQSFIVLIIVLIIYMYPKDIDRSYQGCVYLGPNKKVTTITMHLKGKLYKSQFFNGEQIRGTIEIQGNKYNTDLSKTNSPRFIGSSSFEDNDFIVRLSDDLESIDMTRMGTTSMKIFAPAKNKEDYLIVQKNLHTKKISTLE
ncbi:hypothetical protein HBE96_19255 [Clostridium sp. P21]|uniref:Uncharacterized protein n=1 Tax=Clostridium muellerianum TaxID=2716538 RepID=A0A7Y0ELT6_9CLOT|nr:hypothetical protein [Clostridium muellerianum]NMM64750.1 hypothetical protein [Clostridium muellerianum]